MTDRTDDPLRIHWLDGLRGLAAMQVVSLHFAFVLVPAIGQLDRSLIRYGWEKIFINTVLFLPFNGYLAVCIFFVISGAALTRAFSASPTAIPIHVLRRIIRLGLPMAVAMLAGAACFRLVPDMRAATLHLTGSRTWPDFIPADQISVFSVLHQIGLEGLLGGYATESFLPPGIQDRLGLLSQAQSFDMPVWTLHAEFVGSILVSLLVAARHIVPRRVYQMLLALLIVVLSASVLWLFIVGHIAAGWLRTPPARRSKPGYAILLIGLGIIASTTYIPSIAGPVVAMLPAPPFGPRIDPWELQQMLGAVAIFFGLSLRPSLQAGLQTPALRWLGKISFSLYLTHFPLLYTFVCGGFVAISAIMPQGAALIVVTAGGLVVTLTIAVVFERLVDRPAIALSRCLIPRQTDI